MVANERKLKIDTAVLLTLPSHFADFVTLLYTYCHCCTFQPRTGEHFSGLRIEVKTRNKQIAPHQETCLLFPARCPIPLIFQRGQLVMSSLKQKRLLGNEKKIQCAVFPVL